MCLYQSLGDGQTEPGPSRSFAPGLLPSIETLKEMGKVILTETLSRIPHLDFNSPSCSFGE
jgi:hypothetical protein